MYIEGDWARSHQYVWQDLACLWSPLKRFQYKPRPCTTLGTNMLQYIIQESRQATWNAAGRWKGLNTILGFQLHTVSPQRDSTSLSCFLSTVLSSTDSFVAMLSQTVCAQSAHSCSVAMDTDPTHITPSMDTCLNCTVYRGLFIIRQYLHVCVS